MKRDNAIGKLRRARRGELGYTLMELLVVLSILALLAGLVAPRVMNYLSSAKTKIAYLQIKNISAALDLFRLDVGRYPGKEEGIKALVSKPANLGDWRGPYLAEESGVLDPWRRPYVYRFPGQHGEVDLYSLGADGVEGGEGEDTDILGWRQRP